MQMGKKRSGEKMCSNRGSTKTMKPLKESSEVRRGEVKDQARGSISRHAYLTSHSHINRVNNYSGSELYVSSPQLASTPTQRGTQLFSHH